AHPHLHSFLHDALPIFALPGRALALVEVAARDGGHELLRAAAVVAVVRLVTSGERDVVAMVEVVVPERVAAVPAGRRWSQQTRRSEEHTSELQSRGQLV